MKITGPDCYKLKSGPNRYTVTCAKGRNNFSGLATTRQQKIYIVSETRRILYVGATSTSMSVRLGAGWRAKGKSGYYGYQWRHEDRELELDLWLLESSEPDQAKIDIETIEAEIVFLVRQQGQWPEFQNEIHFHVSNEEHRKIAQHIFQRYQTNQAL